MTLLLLSGQGDVGQFFMLFAALGIVLLALLACLVVSFRGGGGKRLRAVMLGLGLLALLLLLRIVWFVLPGKYIR